MDTTSGTRSKRDAFRTVLGSRRARRATGLLADRLVTAAHFSGGSHLLETKLRVLDVACGQLGARSLADLGAVWAVEAGYGLYAYDRYGLDRLLIVDENFTPSVTRRAEHAPNIRLIEGNFGRTEVRDRVGQVSAVVLFDVLLHQVDPDWTDILSMYSEQTEAFVLAGPWYNGPTTIRLTDLPRDEYAALVPDLPVHDHAYERLDEINDARGRPWRDVHDIWQWGITEHDLRRHLNDLGFGLIYYENLGAWQGLASFDSCSLVFARHGSMNPRS